MNCGDDSVKRNIFENFDVNKPSFGENLFAFVKNSSLHGLKFVSDDRLSIYERVFFVICFIVALLLASNLVYKVYQEWNATPVIIAINPKSTYINEIPFPAITICNMNQALASKVRHFQNGTTEFAMLRTLCGRNPDISEINGTNDWSMFQNFIVNAAQPCDRMLLTCRFGGKDMNCSHLFRSVITDEGVCCAFNLVDTQFMFQKSKIIDHFGPFNPPDEVPVSWSPEKGYQQALPPKFYPRPAPGVGKRLGLSIVLDAQFEEYYCSTTNGAGFKALLHNPAEILDVANYGFSLEVGHEIGVVITPRIADASHVLRNMAPKYRHCIFSDEANLKYYATYTRRNCEMECEAKLHRQHCNCVQYYMPHFEPNMSVCSLSDMKCSERVRYRTHDTSEEDFQCSGECLPSCYELKFRTDGYLARLSHSDFLIHDKMIQNMSHSYMKDNIVNAHFYYVGRAFRSETKHRFVGFTEFLSNTGGLMGLFLGFSVLSIIEIVYYMLVRPYFANRRYRASVKYKKLFNVSLRNDADGYYEISRNYRPVGRFQHFRINQTRRIHY